MGSTAGSQPKFPSPPPVLCEAGMAGGQAVSGPEQAKGKAIPGAVGIRLHTLTGLA